MTFEVKNEYVKESLDILAMDMGEAIEKYVRKSTKGAEISLMAMHLDSFFEAAMGIELELDFTYNTVRNIVPTVFEMIGRQMATYPKGMNMVLSMKSLCSYLTLLAINNHDLQVSVRELEKGQDPVDELYSKKPIMEINGKPNPLIWGCLSAACNPMLLEENEYLINFGTVVEAYRELTGEDLEFYGLMDDPDEVPLYS
ncbi:MAG: hypothetical protein IJM69_08865 [Firmicutes bacterium]|nr:hypothetical protein [Bacillota bacterium]